MGINLKNMIRSPFTGVFASLLLIAGIAGVTRGLEPVGYVLIVGAIVALAANGVANLQDRQQSKKSMPQ